MNSILMLLCSLATIGLVLSDDVLKQLERELENLEYVEREAGALSALEEQKRVNKTANEVNPCDKMHCGPGRVCQLNGNLAECVCKPECPEEMNERRWVCTDKNETWNSDCAVFQQRCLCTISADGCKSPENVNLLIDYYGACHEQEICSKEDMLAFSGRMRGWLFNVMRDLAERDALTDHYMQMELEAETNMTRRWTNAAVWKWCDLDGDNDRSVSRHELFPIRSPLVSLERCITPFLDSCDANRDYLITLSEWGNCLELDEVDLHEQCEEIQRST